MTHLPPYLAWCQSCRAQTVCCHDWMLLHNFFIIPTKYMSNKTLLVWLAYYKLWPLHTRDWEPVTSTLQALSLVEKMEPVQVRFTLCLRDQRSMWMQDGCKVYMDSYMASNESCFMVTWTIFNNHLLEVSLTQNQETMALWMLTTIDLFYFIMHEDLHE